MVASIPALANQHALRVSVQEMAQGPTRTTPYRIAAPPPPKVVDVDVMRFAAYTRLIRRLQLTAAFEALLLAGTPFLAPLMVLPAHGVGTHVSTPMHAIAPFDAPARRMPPVHIVLRGPWTCAPHDPTQPMSEWGLEAKFGRELYDIDCANWFW